MKKVLVVGGAGYVGGVIVDLLIKKKYDVTVYDNLLYEESFRKDCKFIFGDIRDTNFYKSKINKFDCIVWLAALVGDGACSINPGLTDEINFQTLKKLIKIYKKRIIFISTCSVYGAQNGLLSEKSNVNPLSHYASSKLKCEEILQKSNSIIFRLGTLFGVSDNYSRIRMDLVVNTLSAKAFFEKKMSVFGGDQFRPILHVKDVARAIEFVLLNSFNIGIYNLSYSNFKIIELAKRIKSHFNDVELIYDDKIFQDSRNYRVDNEKFNMKYNFECKYDIDYGVKELKDLINQKRIVDLYNPRYSNVDFLNKFLSKN